MTSFKNLIKLISFFLILNLVLAPFSFILAEWRLEEIKMPEEMETPQEIEKPEKIEMLEKIEKEEITPKTTFVLPKEEEKLKNEIEIKLQVKDALSVEFYLQRVGELFPIYLGKGYLTGEQDWQYSWNTKNFPNGEYILFAQITNKYGQYKSQEISVSIENEIEKRLEEKRLKKN